MKTVVVTSATGEPITLEEVKWQLRLEPGNRTSLRKKLCKLGPKERKKRFARQRQKYPKQKRKRKKW